MSPSPETCRRSARSRARREPTRGSIQFSVLTTWRPLPRGPVPSVSTRQWVWRRPGRRLDDEPQGPAAGRLPAGPVDDPVAGSRAAPRRRRRRRRTGHWRIGARHPAEREVVDDIAERQVEIGIDAAGARLARERGGPEIGSDAGGQAGRLDRCGRRRARRRARGTDEQHAQDRNRRPVRHGPTAFGRAAARKRVRRRQIAPTPNCAASRTTQMPGAKRQAGPRGAPERVNGSTTHLDPTVPPAGKIIVRRL